MSGRLDFHEQELREQGYTILPGVWSAEQVRVTMVALEKILAAEKEVAVQQNWENATYRVSYVLPQKHSHFLSFCQNPNFLPFIHQVLGPKCVVSSVNGFSMTSMGTAQTLHLDQVETVSGALLTLNAVHVLDSFTRLNGCTRVVPGSHRRHFTPQAAESPEAEQQAVYLEAAAGSVIIYDGGLWHAGSANKTAQPRRAIHTMFCKSWVQPQWNFEKSLSGKTKKALTAEQRALFGFSAQPRVLTLSQQPVLGRLKKLVARLR